MQEEKRSEASKPKVEAKPLETTAAGDKEKAPAEIQPIKEGVDNSSPKAHQPLIKVTEPTNPEATPEHTTAVQLVVDEPQRPAEAPREIEAN
jgi:hypothetical protein